MRNFMRALACVTLFGALAACTPPAGNEQAAKTPSGPIAGYINGEAITETMLDTYAKARFQSDFAQLSAEQQEQSRSDFVQLVALSQEAKARGYNDDPGFNMQMMGALAQVLITKHVESSPVTEEKIRAKYDEMMSSGVSREYKARHILLETEDDAKAVIAELDKGGDFEELAKSKSTGPSASQGGDLGWFGEGRMVPEFWTATIALEPGSYTKEAAKTQFGWHVIKLEEVRDQPYAEAQPQLKAQLQRELVDNYVKQLSASAEAKWNDAASNE